MLLYYPMRQYKVKGKQHRIYEPGDALPDHIMPRKDWKEARVGDWVVADDGCIIQILRRGVLGRHKTIGTCTGTYTTSMDTERRANIYNLSGRLSEVTIHTRKKCTKKEELFASRVAKGQDPVEAYLDIYPSKSETYAKKQAAILLTTERVDTLVNEKLQDTFETLGVDLNYLIGVAKDITDNARNDSDRIRSLNMLWDAFGVIEKQKVTNVTGIFQGLSQEQLEAAQRPELPEHA